MEEESEKRSADKAAEDDGAIAPLPERVRKFLICGGRRFVTEKLMLTI